MFNYKRKNNRLNNAAAGLASGLQAGLAIGMQSHQNDRAEEQARFQRDQALKAGKRADDQLALEAGQRSAEAEAVDSLAQPEPKVDFSPMSGGGSMQNIAATAIGAQSQHEQAIQKVGLIAKKMSEMGTPLAQVKAFMDAAREKTAKAADDGERKFLVDAIHRDVQSDTLFATQADGVRTSNPETEKAMQNLLDAAGNPNVPVSFLKSERVKLKQAVAADRSRLAHRKSMVMALDADIAKLKSTLETQPGPITPAQYDAQSRQMQRLQTLRDQFDVFYDEIHDAKGGPLSFSAQWNDAKNGIAFWNPRTGRPVSFAEEDSVREAEKKIAEQDQELNALKAEKLRVDINTAPLAAQARLLEAEAGRNRSLQGRPQPDNSVRDYAAIADVVDKRLLLNEKYKDLLNDGKTEEANKMRSDMIAAERESARTLSAQAQQDRAALGDRKGATPDTRMEKLRANPQDPFFEGWSDEEIDHWVETGEVPKSK